MLKDDTWRNSAWARRAAELEREKLKTDPETGEVLREHHTLFAVIAHIRESEYRDFAEVVDAVQDRVMNPLFWDCVVEHADFICAYLESARRMRSAARLKAAFEDEEEEEEEDGDLPW